MGMGKTMVEFFSEDIVARVCRYLEEEEEEAEEKE